MIYDIKKCNLCPRMCNADRTADGGFCGGGEFVRVAKVMTHMWEEPCISGDRGTGAVFFSGCSLGCVYCQNRDISKASVGDEYTEEQLAELFLHIEKSGVHTLDLVTPSHFAPQIHTALDISKPNIPVIYNVGGYELADTVGRYMSHADVFLTDFKYSSAETGERYSGAPDYPQRAAEALAVMYEIAGDPEYNDEGIITGGIILRHLVLPGERRDSVKALETAAKAVPPEKVVLSLMSQYTPDFAPRELKNLSRRVTSFEYEYVRDAAIEMGFSGYSQDRTSALAAYTPDFE